ncbi:16S rRNA (cytosine(1402)-N(4))-methyltransferase RsmH [SAR202 cluster bacterium AD-804-J14_MRT_500m]|nr:16S rRNA (cytosine(1402)-N(4))-methyltransferase RsmH [SAR202 cluster bacterium AD-804-J14_MRT_500m]
MSVVDKPENLIVGSLRCPAKDTQGTIYHSPVLVNEVMSGLAVEPGRDFIDCTAGEGGHTSSILCAALPKGRVLAIDSDATALEIACRRLSAHKKSLLLVHNSYANMDTVARDNGFSQVDGILMDLGLSSLQLEGSGRGFSFLKNEPLDMRYDYSKGATAADLINNLPTNELADLIWILGQERNSRAIAKAISNNRPITTSAELASVVGKFGRRRRLGIHPATRTFQALRIAVNNELETISEGLSKAITLLRPGGRLVVLSYHSLEDRIVKDAMRNESRECICPPEAITCICTHKASIRRINRRVITASKGELDHNPRSRSARLRIAERLNMETT